MRIKKMITLLIAVMLIVAMVGCDQQATAGDTEQAADQAPTVVEKAVNAASDEVATQTTEREPKRQPKNGEKYVIGVSLPSPDNQWVAAVIQNAKTQAELDKDKFDITITTANNPSKQVSDVEDLLVKNPDAMVIFPIESAPLTPIAEKVFQEGIPLVILTRGIESNSYDSFIHGDDYAGGINAAHYIGKRLNGQGKVVIMRSSPSAITDMRAAGFEETRAKYYPGLEIIATGEGQFAREPAMKAMENILQANPKIDAVYSMDDEQSLGCIAAIKDAGREGEMFVTGFGGNKAALEMLMSNDPLYGASFFYTPLQGGSAVKLAALMAMGLGMSDLWEQSVPREIIFSADTITSENAKDYYNPDSQY